MALLKPIALAVAFAGLAPAVASAQPGAGPPPPPDDGDPGGYGYGMPVTDAEGFYLRRGIAIGGSLGIGGMDTDSGIFECRGCGGDPAALGLAFHLGGMIDHRTAILGEYWAQFQQLDYYGDAVGSQHMLMAALQYWALPQLWVKGGVGGSVLQVSYSDGFVDNLAQGLAIMGAVGYEVATSPQFAFDIQLRLGTGAYDAVEDRAGTVMVSGGVNWY